MTATDRPSTHLGNGMGRTMRAAAWSFDFALPLMAIKLYQLIPSSTRGRLFGGPSASVDAARQIKLQGGGAWQLIRSIAISNHPDRPSMP